MQLTQVRQHRIDALLILSLALGMRIVAAIFFRNMLHPDEIFSVLEQTHRLVFGYGIKPWEIEDGVRSMVFPSFLVLPMWLSSRLSDNPKIYLATIEITLVCISVVPVILVFNFGKQFSRIHSIIGGLVAATWFEAISFSYHPLTEMISGSFLLAALCVQSRQEKSRADYVALGVLFALTLGFRIQFAPAVVVMLYFLDRKPHSTWAWLVMGAVAPTLIFGWTDWLDWGYPFASYVNYFKVNFLQSKASSFGTEDALWYVRLMFSTWTGALPVIVILCTFFWRKYKLWIAVALSLLIAHSFIPHKEYRFVEPAFYILAIVAGFSSVDLFEWAGSPLKPRRLICILVSFWCLTSASLAFTGDYVKKWQRRTEYLEAELFLNSDSQLCGLLIFDHAGRSGGYAYLHRNVPLYWDNYQRDSNKKYLSTYNAILADEEHVAVFEPEFRKERCFHTDFDNVCVLKRPGVCTSNPEYPPILEQHRFGEKLPPRPSDRTPNK